MGFLPATGSAMAFIGAVSVPLLFQPSLFMRLKSKLGAI